MLSFEYLLQAHYSLLREVSSVPGTSLTVVENDSGIDFKKLKRVLFRRDVFTNSELDLLKQAYPFLQTELYRNEPFCKQGRTFS